MPHHLNPRTLQFFHGNLAVLERPGQYHSANTLNKIIIHQTHYEKSNWSRAFNQFTIAEPLGVFSSETKWLNASLLFLRMNYVKNV